MQDTSLYQQILGLQEPWFVTRVQLDVQKTRVDVYVEHRKDATWTCPACGKSVSLYDHAEERSWRHLDSCQFQTFLHARVPRIACPDHGIRNANLPWGERGSRFTMMMERLIIDVLQQSYTVMAACRLLRISWDEAYGVMIRAVRRGLERRDPNYLPKYITVDEKSIRRGHDYVTLLCDLERAAVMEVGEGRDTAALSELYGRLSEKQRHSIEAVAMDMSAAYVRATGDCLPDGEKKIVFDRFHIMRMANDALNRVRQQEYLKAGPENRRKLKGTKQMLLWARENLPERYQERLSELRESDLETARAWAMKENLRRFWQLSDPKLAERHLRRWLTWAKRSRIKPMMHLAKSLGEKLKHILSYCRHPITSGVAEGINSKVQSVKRKAAGFRNRWNFMQAIMFYCGKLDLYPR